MTAAVAVVGLLSLAPCVDLPTLFWGIAPKVEADDLASRYPGLDWDDIDDLSGDPMALERRRRERP